MLQGRSNGRAGVALGNIHENPSIAQFHSVRTMVAPPDRDTYVASWNAAPDLALCDGGLVLDRR
jgi:hypothetical protein